MGRLQCIVDGCSAKRWEDLTKKKVAAFLDDRLAQGADDDNKTRFSRRTFNFYTKAAKRYSRWLQKELALECDPLEDLETKTFEADTHQVHERRALTQAEAMALLQAAKNGHDILGMTGQERYLAYRLAIETGLRCGEIRALTRECFDFDNLKDPKIRLSGKHTKNSKTAILPLRHDTAIELQAYVKWRGGPLFPLPHRTSVMMQRDCKAAEIAYKDAQDRYADFHSLRHTCGTFLAAAGTHPKTAQHILRHSNISLTMDLYTDYLEGSDRPAVESMWKIQATGTDS